MHFMMCPLYQDIHDRFGTIARFSGRIASDAGMNQSVNPAHECQDVKSFWLELAKCLVKCKAHREAYLAERSA